MTVLEVAGLKLPEAYLAFLSSCTTIGSRSPRPGDHQILVMLIHLPDLNHRFMDPAVALYEIRISGHLGVTLLSAFPAMASQRHGAHTVLTGLLDQSALYGVLAQVEALGLNLLEVRRLKPPAAGAGRRELAW